MTSCRSSRASTSVHLARLKVHLYGNFKTEVFDVKKRALLIQFAQKEKGKEPGSFTLTVEGDVGILRIDDRVITSPFSWEM